MTAESNFYYYIRRMCFKKIPEVLFVRLRQYPSILIVDPSMRHASDFSANLTQSVAVSVSFETRTQWWSAHFKSGLRDTSGIFCSTPRNFGFSCFDATLRVWRQFQQFDQTVNHIRSSPRNINIWYSQEHAVGWKSVRAPFLITENHAKWHARTYMQQLREELFGFTVIHCASKHRNV